MLQPAARPARIQFPSRTLLVGAALAVALASVSLAPRLLADEPPPTTPPPTGTGNAGSVTDPNAPEFEDKKPTSKKGKREAKKEKKKEEEAKKAIDLGGKTATEWYAEAVRRVDAGKYQDARAILLPLEDSARAADIQEQVKLLLADAYFYNGGDLNYAEALARYRGFLTFFPGSSKADYAQFQVGECYFKQLGRPDRDQSYTANAIAEYQRVSDAYPSSPYVSKAQSRELEAKARAARHEFEIVKYYYDWDDYSAALKRVSEMLMDRPEAQDREHALFIAADSCYKLGRSSEGDAYAARLKQDYPASAWSGKLHSGNEGQALAKVEKHDRKREKELRRTYHAQRRREDRRTRQVRKDSGLEGRLPPQPVRTALEHPEATANGDKPIGVPSTGAAAAAAPPADRENAHDAKETARQQAEVQKKEKLAKQSEAERKHQEKLEADEKEQAEREAAQAKKAEDKKAQEDAKKKASSAADSSKAEKQARKEAEKASDEAHKQAERDAKEKAHQEKAEAAEQAAAKKKADQAAKAKAKADAEAAKQAAKDAEKAKKEAEKAAEPISK